MVKLVDRVDPDLIIPYLAQENCLSKRDLERIECRQRLEGPLQAAKLMLHEVFSRANGWYEPFMTALYEQGHSDLVKEIDPGFQSTYLKKQEDEDLSRTEHDPPLVQSMASDDILIPGSNHASGQTIPHVTNIPQVQGTQPAVIQRVPELPQNHQQPNNNQNTSDIHSTRPELDRVEVGNQTVEPPEATVKQSNITINIASDNVQIGRNNTFTVSSASTDTTDELDEDSTLYNVCEEDQDTEEGVSTNDELSLMTESGCQDDEDLEHITGDEQQLGCGNNNFTPVSSQNQQSNLLAAGQYPRTFPNACIEDMSIDERGDKTIASIGRLFSETSCKVCAEETQPPLSDSLLRNSKQKDHNQHKSVVATAVGPTVSSTSPTSASNGAISATCETSVSNDPVSVATGPMSANEINLMDLVDQENMDRRQRDAAETSPKLKILATLAEPEALVIYAPRNDLNLERCHAECTSDDNHNVMLSKSDNNESSRSLPSGSPCNTIIQKPGSMRNANEKLTIPDLEELCASDDEVTSPTMHPDWSRLCPSLTLLSNTSLQCDGIDEDDGDSDDSTSQEIPNRVSHNTGKSLNGHRTLNDRQINRETNEKQMHVQSLYMPVYSQEVPSDLNNLSSQDATISTSRDLVTDSQSQIGSPVSDNHTPTSVSVPVVIAALAAVTLFGVFKYRR